MNGQLYHRPYWIVIGKRGIGKSLYIEAMRKVMPDTKFLEVQRLCELDNTVKRRADKIIEIREVKHHER